MVNQLQLTIFIFLCLKISVTLSTTRDLINFNVFQTGSRIHGHYKLPGNQLKVKFQLDQVNSSYYTFNLSSQPDPFDVNGDLAIIEHDNGLVEFKGQAASLAGQVKVIVDSKIATVANGHLIETKINFNKSNMIVNYSLGLDLLDNCWPFSLRHNITTVPVGLVTYRSEVKGYCDGYRREENNVTLSAELGSNQWQGLNTTLDQYWTFNSTGGSEMMTFINPMVGSMTVTNNWANDPVPVTRKRASFISASKLFPNFRLSYLVDNGKKSFSYEPY